MAYTPTKQELLNAIKEKQALLKKWEKLRALVAKWLSSAKKLDDFAGGQLLSRLTGYSDSQLSDEAKQALYVWISLDDQKSFNENPLIKSDNSLDISPDFHTRFYSTSEALDREMHPERYRNHYSRGGIPNTSEGNQLNLFTKNSIFTTLTNVMAKKASVEYEIFELQKKYKELYKVSPPTGDNNDGKKKGNNPDTEITTFKDISNLQTKYNVPSVKESYYSANMFNPIKTGDSGSLTPEEQTPLYQGNQPHKVKDAKELWNNALGSKGMIQVSTVIAEIDNITVNNLDATNKTTLSATYEKYGFQFLYNPSTIEMQYMGIAQTDMTMYTSGREAFNLIPPTTTSATIGFDILLNRMNDMKYYSTNGKLLKPEVYPEGGVPSTAEQKQIYNMGTMYDVEYLLRTLLGYTMKSYLRNNIETADMGWFSKRPVELHLGKNLRYLGYVGGMSLRHAIFDERMVPLFTTMRIEFSRIPDYADAKTRNADAKA